MSKYSYILQVHSSIIVQVFSDNLHCSFLDSDVNPLQDFVLGLPAAVRLPAASHDDDVTLCDAARKRDVSIGDVTVDVSAENDAVSFEQFFVIWIKVWKGDFSAVLAQSPEENG